MAKNKKFNLKSKKTWKSILLISLACITLIGAITGISALFKKAEETTKTINPTYAVGGLTDNGAYLETKESIYTKDAFECQGLDIEIAFNNNISYRVYFYDRENQFIESSTLKTSNFKEEIPITAMTCRIVITPNDDQKVSWYELHKYSNQLEIKVNKEQKDLFSENLFDVTTCLQGKTITGGTIDSVGENANEELLLGQPINVEGYKEIYIFFYPDDNNLPVAHLFDANGTLQTYIPKNQFTFTTTCGKYYVYGFELPEIVTDIRVESLVGHECLVYGVK